MPPRPFLKILVLGSVISLSLFRSLYCCHFQNSRRMLFSMEVAVKMKECESMFANQLSISARTTRIRLEEFIFTSFSSHHRGRVYIDRGCFRSLYQFISTCVMLTSAIVKCAVTNSLKWCSLSEKHSSDGCS